MFLQPGNDDFAYVGTAPPVEHEGERPIAFIYALHTPVDDELLPALGG